MSTLVHSHYWTTDGIWMATSTLGWLIIVNYCEFCLSLAFTQYSSTTSSSDYGVWPINLSYQNTHAQSRPCWWVPVLRNAGLPVGRDQLEDSLCRKFQSENALNALLIRYVNMRIIKMELYFLLIPWVSPYYGPRYGFCMDACARTGITTSRILKFWLWISECFSLNTLVLELDI
jgi:hypothetical protein